MRRQSVCKTSAGRARKPMRRSLWVMGGAIAALVTLMVVSLISLRLKTRQPIASLPSSCPRPRIAVTDPLPAREYYRMAQNALIQKDYSAAERYLDRVVREVGGDTGRRALATKMILEIALLAAEAHLADEFKQLVQLVPTGSEAYDSFVNEGKSWIAKANRHIDRLNSDARLFKTHFYKRGSLLESPLALRIQASDLDAAEKALLDLQTGEFGIELFDELANAVHEVALRAVFGDIVLQPDCLEGRSVVMGGPLITERLLWNVGSKLKDEGLAKWYLEEILAVTEHIPNNPVRLRAQSALTKYYTQNR